MKGYIIGRIIITNMEGYAPYIEKAKPIAESFGGTYIVRGGNPQSLEGDETAYRHVVISFPSVEAAKNFYFSDAYQGIIHLRQNNAEGTLTIVEGYE